MSSVLWFGFLLGMRHALDADHLAAVASLAGPRASVPGLLRLAASWALGHSLTLAVVGSIVLLSGTIIPPGVEALLECLVGFLLIFLGIGMLRRLLGAGRQISVEGQERESYSKRALMIGVAQGLAGSATLVLVTLAAMDSLWNGLGYLILFGCGVVAGMGLLSCLIALPLQAFAKHLSSYYNIALLMVGFASVTLGGLIIYENSRVVLS